MTNDAQPNAPPKWEQIPFASDALAGRLLSEVVEEPSTDDMRRWVRVCVFLALAEVASDDLRQFWTETGYGLVGPPGEPNPNA